VGDVHARLIVLSGVFLRIIMARLANTKLDPDDIAAIAVKALPWAFFVGTISTATTSLTSNTQLVTKVYFPREVLPLSALTAQAFDLAVASVALSILLAVVHPPASAVTLLWVPVLVLLLVGFTAAMALFLSCANLFFRDVKYIVQVLLTFGVFFTPVFFDAGMLGAGSRRLIMLNPLSPILEGLRVAVVEGHNLAQPLLVGAAVAWDPRDLLYTAVVTVAALLGSSLLFHRSEFVFAEYV
jgi:ABC-type polysaccharide/polyol phosphate export permease